MKKEFVLMALLHLTLIGLAQQSNKSNKKNNTELAAYKNLFVAVKARQDSLDEQWSKKSQEEQSLVANQQAYGKIANQISQQRKNINVKWIDRHPGSMISLQALKNIDNPIEMNTALVEPIFKKLSANVRYSPEGLEYEKKLALCKTFDIGQIAPDFAAKDSSGKIISIRDFRGRYVFVDFWASWCHWCREENPSMVEAYHQYREKGFSIIGFSCDKPTDRAKWLKALQEDQTPWIQISDMMAFDGEAAKYDVHALPKSFLIDPNGKIIARNLRREKLQETLAALFK